MSIISAVSLISGHCGGSAYLNLGRRRRLPCATLSALPWPRGSLRTPIGGEIKSSSKIPTLPRLVLSSPTNPETLNLYDPAMLDGEGRKNPNREIHLPELAGNICIGSSQGFIFSIPNCCSPDVVAVNPLTGDRLHLPPTSNLPDFSCEEDVAELTLQYLCKDSRRLRDRIAPSAVDLNYCSLFHGVVALSPSLDLVVLIRALEHHVDAYFAHLAPSASSTEWIPLRLPLNFISHCIFHKGYFIVLNHIGGFAILEDSGDPSDPQAFIRLCDEDVRGELEYMSWNYLVESPDGEDLFLVCRLRDWEDTEEGLTRHFVVFRLDNNDRYSWKHVDSLGGLTFFVGRSSVAVSAADFAGLKPDSIYFTEDPPLDLILTPHKGGLSDSGVFDLQDQTIRFFRLNIDGSGETRPYWLPSVWVVPAMC